MPTHGETGRQAVTNDVAASPSPAARSARTQAPNRPTPGITNPSASATSFASAITDVSAPTRSSARATEWRFPIP